MCLFLFWLKKKSLLSTIFHFIKKHPKEILLYFAISLLSFLPFIYLYLPAAKMFGAYSWTGEEASVSNMLFNWFDYFNVGTNNLIWHFTDLSWRPMWWELQSGYPFFTLFLFLAALVFGFYQFVKMKKVDLTKIIYLSTLLAIVICLLLIFKIGGHSLWYLIYKFIPAGSSIRAVGRFAVFLSLPIGICVAALLSFLQKQFPTFKGKLILIVICGLVCLEQLNLTAISYWTKEVTSNFIQTVPTPPSQCSSFFIFNHHQVDNSAAAQVDAWLIASYYHLPTINGYSGQVPPNWEKSGCSKQECKNIHTWISEYNLSAVCSYDVDNARWSPLTEEG
jgi:hypothetical protein